MKDLSLIKYTIIGVNPTVKEQRKGSVTRRQSELMKTSSGANEYPKLSHGRAAKDKHKAPTYL